MASRVEQDPGCCQAAPVPSRIVTYALRPKRPPRKRKAAALGVPAIVTVGHRQPPSPVEHEPVPAAPPQANDDVPSEPAPTAAKPAIVTTPRRKRAKPQRADEPDDPEADAAIRTWLERAKWGHGPSG
jgi:hypothetical protein